MSEDIEEYNQERGELKFVRLRSMPDDLIGYVTYKEECIVIEQPLRIEIDTLFDEGKQILAMQEYLPQSVIEMREVEFYNDEVLFATPVKKEFIEQYEFVADFFYNNNSKIKEPIKNRSKDIPETVEKVVSILDAMAKKDKGPVH